MGKIITIPFTEKFIERLADHIVREYADKGHDLGRLGVVFGGRRPALFLKRVLARRIKGPFYPPRTFAIDELITDITASQGRKPLLDLDHCFTLYELARTHVPHVLKGKEEFVQFLPWAREILHFIEQLDLEDAPADALKVLQAHAAVGFDVPPDINRLLESLVVLRREYHRYLDAHGLTSRGHQYLQASRLVKDYDPLGIDHILFCNFFYLHRTEMSVVKELFDRGKASLFMQGDERKWPALKRIGQHFDQSITEGKEVVPTSFDLKVYAAFDMHAQAGIVAEILKGVDDPSDTVIVLPDADFMLPLLSAIGPQLGEFNISLGYPLKRSSLYALLEAVIAAHKTMKGELYYSRDYLRVLRHPLVKELEFEGQEGVARVLVQKLEEVLTGAVASGLSGQVFLGLEHIVHDDIFLAEAELALHSAGIVGNADSIKKVMTLLHGHLFGAWQDLSTFKQLASALKSLCSLMTEQSGMEQYPFNERVAARLVEIAEEWASARFGAHVFAREDLLRIVQERLGKELVAFGGSPLRGLQVLGLLETRSLSFTHVIVVDVNERVLPDLNIYEPLIPREVMIKMSIDRLELEEEIQRYQFMRLISSARDVHLIYQERTDKERSRFVEELIWEQELKKDKIGTVAIVRPAFNVALRESHRAVEKSPLIVDFLKGFTFSATSVNTYMHNPYDFYRNYVLGLREKEDLLDEPESRHVGTFVHGLLEDAFKPFINKRPVIDAAFRKHFARSFEEGFSQTFGRGVRSDAFLLKSVLEHRLERFLDVEAERLDTQVKEILFVEKKFEDTIDLPCGPVRFSYRVDRVDAMQDGTIMVIDYKTGGMDVMPSGFEVPTEMSREILRDQLGSFQMPLYLHYLDRQYPGLPVNASLYQLRTMKFDRFITPKTILSREQMVSGFKQALGFIMAEIFNPKISFIDDPVEIE